jgi:tRNA splicing endonuclease
MPENMQPKEVYKGTVFEELLVSLEGLCNSIQLMGLSLNKKERNEIYDDLESRGFLIKKLGKFIVEKYKSGAFTDFG